MISRVVKHISSLGSILLFQFIDSLKQQQLKDTIYIGDSLQLSSVGFHHKFEQSIIMNYVISVTMSVCRDLSLSLVVGSVISPV